MKSRAFFRFALGSIVVYEKISVFETHESQPALKIVDKAKVDVRLLQGKSVSRLNKFEKFRGGKAEKRFKAGHLCFVAEKNGDIVNYVWVSFDATFVDEIGRKIRVGPQSAYRYDGYTVPEYRGLGILPVALTRVADYLFQNGIEEIYDVVASDNLPSLRSHEKIGSRKMGEITLIKLFGSSRYLCKGSTVSDRFRLKEMFGI